MYEQAFLTACYILGLRYHSGQWSKGHRLMCLAEQRGSRNHSAWDIGRTVEQLQDHQVYPRGGEFRCAVAFWLLRLRHHRESL